MKNDELTYRNIAFDEASFDHLQRIKRDYARQHGARLSNSLAIKLIIREHANHEAALEVDHDKRG